MYLYIYFIDMVTQCHIIRGRRAAGPRDCPFSYTSLKNGG
jgi:hypothetical protein